MAKAVHLARCDGFPPWRHRHRLQCDCSQNFTLLFQRSRQVMRALFKS
jgi:hypothetical protein